LGQDPEWIAFLITALAVVAILAAYFWVLEKRGLLPQKGPLTLTWTLRRWLGIIRPRAPRRYFLIPAFIAVCAAIAGGGVWLAVHVLVG